MQKAKHAGAERVQYLESLRGLAAFAVVLFHFLAAFYPGALLGRTIDPVDSKLAGDVFYGPPLGFLVSGHFAVAVFFVLSGYVLTKTFFQTRDPQETVKQARKRIIRLGIPVAVAVLISAVLIGLGAMASQALAVLNNSPEAARVFGFSPNWLMLPWDMTFGVFLAGNAEYDPVLWTMRIELFGSFLVFAIATFLSKLSWRWILYTLLALVLWRSYYPCFIVGLALADLMSDPALRQRMSSYVSGRIFAINVLVVALLGSFPYAGPALESGIYNFLHLPIGVQADSFRIWQSVGASLLVALILLYQPVQRVLHRRPLIWLGSISFGLYLTHYLVIHSLGARIFLAMEPAMGYHAAFIIMFAICLPIIIGVAWIWTLLVDKPTIRLANKVQLPSASEAGR